MILGAVLMVLLMTGCGSRKSLSPSKNKPTNTAGPRTISLREATLLVRTQWGGNVTCGAVETNNDGRAVYPCVVTNGTENLSCFVPQLYFPSGSKRFPTAPQVPAVLCSPAHGFHRPVIPSPKKSV